MPEGYHVFDAFLGGGEAGALLAQVDRYRAGHQLTRIQRPSGPRPLDYFVIGGVAIAEHLPELHRLRERVNRLVNGCCGQRLAPLANARAAVNVNITPPGGAYRWHYDRNAVTAIVYLNDVEGGETEMYPRYRVRIPARYSAVQRALDRFLQVPATRRTFGRLVTVRPKAGRVLVMEGNRCLHSVRAVNGTRERIAVILSYDEPEATFAIEKDLDAYLYTGEQTGPKDPNYLG